LKNITFKNEGGGFRVIEVIGDNKKESWGKILGQFIYDYQFNSVKADLRKDKFKIDIIK